MIIIRGCSKCKSAMDHCDECSEQIMLEIKHTPPNRDCEIVINIEYPNSKGEMVTVTDVNDTEESQ